MVADTGRRVRISFSEDMLGGVSEENLLGHTILNILPMDSFLQDLECHKRRIISKYTLCLVAQNMEETEKVEFLNVFLLVVLVSQGVQVDSNNNE